MKNIVYSAVHHHMGPAQRARMSIISMDMERINVFIAVQHQLVHVQKALMANMKNDLNKIFSKVI